MFWTGEYRDADKKSPKIVRAHRWAYVSYVGKIKKGLLVCHYCDTPGCQNPAHWFLGTNAENIRDCWNKGRGRKVSGEDSSINKLTEYEVREIRRLHQDGALQKDLATQFGVTFSNIHCIVRGKSWKHIA